jgi:hypothetical protein
MWGMYEGEIHVGNIRYYVVYKEGGIRGDVV